MMVWKRWTPLKYMAIFGILSLKLTVFSLKMAQNTKGKELVSLCHPFFKGENIMLVLLGSCNRNLGMPK